MCKIHEEFDFEIQVPRDNPWIIQMKHNAPIILPLLREDEKPNWFVEVSLDLPWKLPIKAQVPIKINVLETKK